MALGEVKRGASLGEQVAMVLRNAIVAGEIRAGEQLLEEKTAAELGVSRGPVREAFRRLAFEGLLDGHGRGYVVLGITEEDVEEIYSLRQALESLAAVRALSWAGADDDVHLRRLVDEMGEVAAVGDGLRVAHLDVEFHSSFFAFAHHRRLTTAWEQLSPSVTLLLEVSNSTDRDLTDAAAAHERLLKCFVARDSPALRDELQHHLDHAKALLAQAALAQRQRR